MDLLGDVGQMEAHFGPFGDSVNQHARYTVCAKHAMGLEVILCTYNGTLR
jgi:hypothetical protein